MAVTGVHDERIDRTIIDNRAEHVARLFLDRVQASPRSEAFRYLDGGRWVSLTWQQTGDAVETLAAGLIAVGVRPGQRVALASGTRIEWVLADLAVLLAGAATTTVYPSTTADEVAYIVADSGSVLVFAENDDQVAKLEEHRAELPELQTIVSIDGKSDGDWVIGLDELRQLGAEQLRQRPHAVMERVAGIRADDLAILIYTSGTTGRPKGVRLRHSSLTYEAATVASIGDLSADDLQLLWLPLAHVFGTVLLMLPLQIGFPTAVDGRVEAIVDNLLAVQPTFMGAVPRIFEKAQAAVLAAVAEQGGAKARLFGWAVWVGHRVADRRRRVQDVPAVLKAQFVIADRLVLSKVRARFGGRLRFLNSGSAPLKPEIAEWFEAIGIRVLEGYGLTETSAASFCNRIRHSRLGTVGWPFPGTEAVIAYDGEILLRGPGLMQGYHNLPDLTAAAITADGWFHTGDIGEFDDQGYLRITDRKKDLFKTSAGKYVAPSVIEASLRGSCPYLSQVVVFGADHNFVTALITLDADAITRWAGQHGMAGQSYQQIANSAAARALVQSAVDELNQRLNRWETIKKFVILDRDFTIADGELTPSMKLRRAVVTERNRDRLEALYS
ncbi:MAG TPA: long-chain fatty acid--CoA ligase [Jatrophihabitans sp.]|nr:long-chain fatty acid--CoA ligase [Jatrophihabitans sp.]